MPIKPNLHLRVLALISTAVFGLLVYASTRADRPTGRCKKLSEACRIAGHSRGRTVGRLQRYYKSCIKPLTESGALERLGVSPKDVDACARRWEDRMHDTGAEEDDGE